MRQHEAIKKYFDRLCSDGLNKISDKMREHRKTIIIMLIAIQGIKVKWQHLEIPIIAKTQLIMYAKARPVATAKKASKKCLVS